jgi:hypothetical protein
MPTHLERPSYELRHLLNSQCPFSGQSSAARGVSSFGWDLYDQATFIDAPLVPNGLVFNGRPYDASDVESWPLFKLIIAHDVGRSRDRSTTVIGGRNPYGPGFGLSGSRAEAESVWIRTRLCTRCLD